MIAEEKKQELFSAIAQVRDEAAFDKIAAMVQQLLAANVPAEPAQAGFLQGSVTYLADSWDTPLADADWAHNAPEW
ncbi:MAG: hypothetical protein EOO62_29515 [Hymenobacter sp.]|nr:MAG: hypothetical protein EOO62_29515 [Hymenobacter sp.]